MSEKDRFDIVYFSSIDWNYTWQRPQQLASRLAHYGKLFYVSPLGLRSAVLTDWARILRRIVFELSRPVVASGQRMTIHTPLLYLPTPESPLANRINGRLLHRSIAQWMKRQQVHKPIVWIGVPMLAALEAIEDVDARMIVYDCLDNFPLFHKDPYHIIEAEQQIVSRADIVFATAAELYDRVKPVKPQHTFLLPNAADYEHFAPVTTQGFECPNDLVGTRKPLLGYIGEMANWFDFDLIYDIALRHPEWTFALIGEVHVAVDKKLLELTNVRFLGRKDYAKLPAYLNEFDVCLLPFKINALTSAVNPVKLYEYLAAGKPVVSTPLKEVLHYQNVVEIADRSKFADAIGSALVSTRNPQQVIERQRIARQNTWDIRIEEILRVFRNSDRPIDLLEAPRDTPSLRRSVVGSAASQVSVSVVIPCFNAEKTIVRALESVKQQTWPVLQIICVDDCSTDHTIPIIEEFRSTHPDLSIRILRTPKNSGPSTARNMGWDIASGDYIAFLDADDAWHPEKIAIQYGWMIEHPQIALCGHSHFVSDGCDLSDVRPAMASPNAFVIMPNEILLTNPFVTPSAMLKRSLAYRFEPKRRYTEDYLLWMQMCLDGYRIAMLDAPLAFVFKDVGEKKQSQNSFMMRVGDIENYWQLWRTKKIGFLKMAPLIGFSILKYILLMTFPAAHAAVKRRLSAAQKWEPD